MKNIVIYLTREKKITVCLYLALIILLTALFLYLGLLAPDPSIKTAEAMRTEDEIMELQKLYARLLGVSGSIFPHEEQVILENPFRNHFGSSSDYGYLDYQTYPLKEALQQGTDLAFTVVYDDPDYRRPVYDSSWKNTYYRSWLYLPQKLVEARHRLFTYYGGASNIYDFEGSLGFHESPPVDYHRNINWLVYNFKVESVKKYHHQILLTGKPERSGAEIIAVKVDDVLPEVIDSMKLLFQLSTPEGLEVDYEYGRYGRSEYLKKLKEEGEVYDTVAVSGVPDELAELKMKITRVEQELSKWIPPEEGPDTVQKCRPASFQSLPPALSDNITALKEGMEIPFNILFDNPGYLRPLYHPAWKENMDKGWAYVPMKICENLHSLFVLPESAKEQTDLLGRLAFFEKLPPVKSRELTVLVYNFSVKTSLVYGDRLLLSGTPSRSGVRILSFEKNRLPDGKKLLIQAVTPGGYEIDFFELHR